MSYSKPKFYKKTKFFVIELYRWKAFLIAFYLGNFEIQINMWGSRKVENDSYTPPPIDEESYNSRRESD